MPQNFLNIKRNSYKIILITILNFLININFSICIKENLKENFNDDMNKTGNLTIKDGTYTVLSYKIISTNTNNEKIDKKNKICSIETVEDYFNFCNPFNKIIYDKWVKK
jgi:hypothetical protein